MEIRIRINSGEFGLYVIGTESVPCEKEFNQWTDALYFYWKELQDKKSHKNNEYLEKSVVQIEKKTEIPDTENKKEVKLKSCSRCRQNKSVEEFNKNKCAFDGLQTYCRSCAHEVVREWSKKNRSSKNKEEVKQPEKTIVKKIPLAETKKNFQWNKERDKILRDNFNELGHGGIYDKSLLPGFSLMDIRQRCIELGLLNKYGVSPDS